MAQFSRHARFRRCDIQADSCAKGLTEAGRELCDTETCRRIGTLKSCKVPIASLLREFEHTNFDFRILELKLKIENLIAEYDIDILKRDVIFVISTRKKSVKIISLRFQLTKLASYYTCVFHPAA